MTPTTTSEDVAALTWEQLKQKLQDPMWRLSNLYQIIVKGDDEDDEGLVMQFKPNRAQRRFIARLWHRNIILKARQLGFTTLIAIAWLDHALFNANVRCGIIAQNREAAAAIFRDKVRFAYDNLPPALLAAVPLAKDSADELLFSHNNSSVRVATSMRGGTIHRLHISEYGKICAEFPKKAKEVQTGSIPAVPKNGILVIESTAEGREGDFYNKCQRAMAHHQAKKKLTPRDYRFHFFPWWQEPGYRMDPDGVIVTHKDEEYFIKVEAEMGCRLDAEQRAWYVATREADYPGEDERMMQEYPSTPAESFSVSVEGCYYTAQLALTRKQNRITTVPYLPGIPVNTFWDIGGNDETAIWCHQKQGLHHRFIGFHEATGQGFSYFVQWLQSKQWVLGRHFLPHDAAHRRQGSNGLKSPQEMIEELGLRNTIIVPKIDRVITGINQVRDIFGSCWFDEKECKEGLDHLALYRKQWNTAQACWTEEPRHDVHSNAADAFRQFGQGFSEPGQGKVKRKRGSWRVS